MMLACLTALFACSKGDECDQAGEHLGDCLDIPPPDKNSPTYDPGVCTPVAICLSNCVLDTSCSDLRAAFSADAASSPAAQSFLTCTNACSAASASPSSS